MYFVLPNWCKNEVNFGNLVAIIPEKVSYVEDLPMIPCSTYFIAVAGHSGFSLKFSRRYFQGMYVRRHRRGKQCPTG